MSYKAQKFLNSKKTRIPFKLKKKKKTHIGKNQVVITGMDYSTQPKLNYGKKKVNIHLKRSKLKNQSRANLVF